MQQAKLKDKVDKKARLQLEKVGRAKILQQLKEEAKLRTVAEEKISSLEKVLQTSRQQLQSLASDQEELQAALSGSRLKMTRPSYLTVSLSSGKVLIIPPYAGRIIYSYCWYRSNSVR